MRNSKQKKHIYAHSGPFICEGSGSADQRQQLVCGRPIGLTLPAIAGAGRRIYCTWFRFADG